MKEEEVLNNPDWKLNKSEMKIIGLWPYQQRKFKIFIGVLISIVMHSVLVPVIFRTMIEWDKNINIVLENIWAVIFLEGGMINFWLKFLDEAKFQFVYEEITQDWKRYKDKGEQLILQYCAKRGRLFTIVYTAYIYVSGLGFTIVPGLVPILLDVIIPLNVSRQKMLCIYAEFFIDQQDYYYYLLPLTIIAALCICMIFTAADGTYTNTVYHNVALFQIIDYHLEKLHQLVEANEIYIYKNLKEEIERGLLTCILLHKRFQKNVQSAYHYTFYIGTIIVFISISIGAVLLILNLHNYLHLIIVGIAMSCFGIYIYLVYVSGQRIIDANLHTLEAIYACGWYNFPLKARYLVLFMMMRCTRPCQFTAGPLLVMNLRNTGNVIKLAMSYCTFIFTAL